MKKMISLLLVLIFALGMMSACQKSGDNSTVATVGSEVITAGEMEYAIGVVKNSLTTGMEGQTLDDFWNTLIDGVDPEDYVRDNATELLVNMTLLAHAATEAGVVVTEAEVEEYFAENQETMDGLIAQYGVSVDTLKAVYRKQMLYSKYGEAFLATDERFTPSDETLKQYFQDNFYKAQHILVMTVDANTNEPFSQEEKDAARAKIDSILASIKDGADFEALMKEHTEDPGVEQYPGGYVFAEGEMVPEFYEGTVALAENGISEVIESSYGYHIIKRLPLDLEADFTENRYKAQSVYVYEVEGQLIEELKKNVEVSLKDAEIKEIPVK